MNIRALVLALLLSSPAAAQTLLHPMFADHAVLQQGQPIHIYGQARPGSEVSVRLGNASATAHAAAGGQWSAILPVMAAGGPYNLQVSGGGETQQVSDVLVGDVFLCTGQSNMQVSVRRAANADAEIAAATDSDVRELTVGLVASPTVLASFPTLLPGRWKRRRRRATSRPVASSSRVSCAAT